MTPLRIGLVQINNSFSNQHYFPYSVGLLQAYVQAHAAEPGRYAFLPPLYSRLRVDEAVARLADADVVGFSVYVWNVRLSLEIARRLRARRPDVLIVFGGPQVPDRAEAFLRANPAIDVACHGEGERVFRELLERHPDGRREEVPSISWLTAEGGFATTPRAARLTDLAEVPSPFLAGVFEPLLAADPGHQWLALWETNRGCPFACTFCDWGSAVAAKVYRFDMERLQREVDWFAAHRVEFIFCCDANFGILPRDVEIAEYVAETKRRTGYPHALSVQSTKNATDRAYQVQKLLSDHGLNKGVTISLQSIDPPTLESIKRKNIASDSYQELQRRFTRDRVGTYTDLILGLPGETYDSFADGVAAVIDDGQHNRIQFNNLSILPNAEMGDPAYQARFGMETVESRIINIHGACDAGDDEEVPETQQLVIATATMPRPDWVRTRAFSWMAAFLHFDKVLQIPLVLLRHAAELGYRELIELFTEVDDPEAFPVLTRARRFFEDKARDIQRGGPEYCASERWLRIWWPADEYLLIQLGVDGALDAFYAEVERLLHRRLAVGFADVPGALLHEAIRLNRTLLKVPAGGDDVDVSLSWNVWEVYESVLCGVPIALERRPTTVRVERAGASWASLDDWCREVVWYGNKKGAYLHGTGAAGRELAGHY